MTSFEAPAGPRLGHTVLRVQRRCVTRIPRHGCCPAVRTLVPPYSCNGTICSRALFSVCHVRATVQCPLRTFRARCGTAGGLLGCTGCGISEGDALDSEEAEEVARIEKLQGFV